MSGIENHCEYDTVLDAIRVYGSLDRASLIDEILARDVEGASREELNGYDFGLLLALVVNCVVVDPQPKDMESRV